MVINGWWWWWWWWWSLESWSFTSKMASNGHFVVSAISKQSHITAAAENIYMFLDDLKWSSPSKLKLVTGWPCITHPPRSHLQRYVVLGNPLHPAALHRGLHDARSRIPPAVTIHRISIHMWYMCCCLYSVYVYIYIYEYIYDYICTIIYRCAFVLSIVEQ